MSHVGLKSVAAFIRLSKMDLSLIFTITETPILSTIRNFMIALMILSKSNVKTYSWDCFS